MVFPSMCSYQSPSFPTLPVSHKHTHQFQASINDALQSPSLPSCFLQNQGSGFKSTVVTTSPTSPTQPTASDPPKSSNAFHHAHPCFLYPLYILILRVWGWGWGRVPGHTYHWLLPFSWHSAPGVTILSGFLTFTASFSSSFQGPWHRAPHFQFCISLRDLLMYSSNYHGDRRHC